MSEHTDDNAATAAAAGETQLPPPPEGGCELPWCGQAGEPTSRNMIAVERLTVHPGNVREDLDLDPEFLASIEANGVMAALRITAEGDRENPEFVVIDGHRRLAAAVKFGITEVPYDLAAERHGDLAGQFLDMYNTNLHKPLTQLEEASALFSASQAGANRTRIRQSTGLKAGQVKTALAAATLTDETRAQVGQQRSAQMSLEDLAILAEFQDDPDAVSRLLASTVYRDNMEHEAQRLRQERAVRAEHEKLCAELAAAGVTITDDLPDNADWLENLQHDGEELTPELHATCPGRGAFFYSYDLESPVYYCADPSKYGHQSLETEDEEGEQTPAPGQSLESATGLGPAGSGGPRPGPAGPPAEDPEVLAERRRIAKGNQAWRAAAEVRHRWLGEDLLARRSAPRDVDVWIAQQLLTLPGPLRRYLTWAISSEMVTKLTGKETTQISEDCVKAAARKLPLLMLTPLAAAYEHALTGAAYSDETWQDRSFSPCPYADAGAYFRFFASVGYQLSEIEQAVADGTRWEPGNDLTETVGTAESAEPDSSGTGDEAVEENSAQDVSADVPEGTADVQDVPAQAEDVPTGELPAAA